MDDNEFSGPPVRLQLLRKKGFDLQAHSAALNGRRAVNCARPGPYGNPFIVGGPLDAEMACFMHRQQILRGLAKLTIARIREKLRGKNLACFCKPDAPHCHVDSLLEIANSADEP